jgi:hypothetical protein
MTGRILEVTVYISSCEKAKEGERKYMETRVKNDKRKILEVKEDILIKKSFIAAPAGKE